LPKTGTRRVKNQPGLIRITIPVVWLQAIAKVILAEVPVDKAEDAVPMTDSMAIARPAYLILMKVWNETVAALNEVTPQDAKSCWELWNAFWHLQAGEAEWSSWQAFMTAPRHDAIRVVESCFLPGFTPITADIPGLELCLAQLLKTLLTKMTVLGERATRGSLGVTDSCNIVVTAREVVLAPGDRLCAIPGAAGVFILRKHEQDYEFVSQCQQSDVRTLVEEGEYGADAEEEITLC
jgi:hypothetical protein